MDDTTKNVAEQFIQYLNEENFDKAESCLDPDLSSMACWVAEKAHLLILKI
ncbi:hypothetical protein [Chryseobacterium indologenes]|uniref:hypothetical protein n=1 Tax=Chryseobacterium indologenes TaxID=253 RepID=UPI00162342E9|nr:hypothetical protein [Chryseobacterium indologenes]